MKIGFARQPQRPAMTLLEVVISLAIFLASVVALSQLVNIGSDRALEVQLRAQASMICQSKLTEVMIGAEPLNGSGTQETGGKDSKVNWNYTIESSESDVPGVYTTKVTVRLERENMVIESALVQMVLDPSRRGSTVSSSSSSSSSSMGAP